MGRPPKPGARRINVSVRLSAEELRDFKREAKRAGMPLGAWLIEPRRQTRES